MYHTLLGADGFRKGMDLYFERHDGSAVTCDDFRAAMADANNVSHNCNHVTRFWLVLFIAVLIVLTQVYSVKTSCFLRLITAYDMLLI
jgi:hypothetical protein